jgi:antitoxin HigA-1
MMRNLKPVTPGELLLEEFLMPMGVSQYRLAKKIGVPAQRIGDIVTGKRAITADTDLRLCRFFGLSNGYWLRAQAAYDTEVAERMLARIVHERFCCNRRSAATTGLRSAGSPLEPSTYCTSTHRVLGAPRAALATRLSDFATNRHEQ